MFVTREHDAGESAAATWMRDGQLTRPTARLGTRADVDRAMAPRLRLTLAALCDTVCAGGWAEAA